MAGSYADLLDEPSEIEHVPKQLRKFLKPTETFRFEGNWAHFAYGYEQAFEILAKEVKEKWHGRDFLAMPLFYLARHSIELHLKEAILFYSEHHPSSPDVEGHRLMSLWNQLLGYINGVGYPIDDEWTVYCGKLLNHINETDPDGEHFRYPESKSGKSFTAAAIELEGLIKAHWHLCMYCGAATSMLEDGYRPE